MACRSRVWARPGSRSGTWTRRGDLDAVLADREYGNQLLLNAGTGAFADATGTNLPSTSDFPEAVSLGDVDGDGDLDALVGNSSPFVATGGQSRLYLNGGGGMFSDVTAAALPPAIILTRAVALGDADEDGDLDAFLGNQDLSDVLYL